MPESQAERTRRADLRRWAERHTAATPIASLAPRTEATCVGVVAAIRYLPGARFDAVVEDGSGRLLARWQGRTRPAGVELGAGLRLEGRVATGERGEPMLRNPEYAVIAEPYGQIG